MDNNTKILNEIKKMKSVKEFIETNNLTNKAIDDNLLTFYSYKLKREKCIDCRGLEHCKQSILGQVPVLEIKAGQIGYDYYPCNYQKELDEKREKQKQLELIATSFSQYDFTNVYHSAERTELLIKVSNIYNAYKNGNKTKGLYIYGPYGSGKSYILAWLAEKLVELGAHVVFAYYPDLVRQIKSSIANGTIEDYLEALKNVEVLMLDDIGGESNSDFIRDEVLGAVLQTRMCNNALTFMSSNLNPKLLLDHLSSGSKDVDRVKGSRVFERINTLMEFVELKDKNYR